MLRKVLVVTVLLLLSLLSVWSYFFWWQAPSSYTDHQVKKIAPVVKSYLLNLDQHIRFSTRPQETFNFPINIGEVGPTTSLYSGDNQYPFYCMTLASRLGQPIVDNSNGYGVPVYEPLSDSSTVVGFSKDCSVATKIRYFTISIDKANADKNILAFEPTDISEATNQSTKLFRIEQGTINRFIYTLIMPIAFNEIGDRLAKSQWNQRLIYQFNGGSGIGFRQGRQLASKVMRRQVEQLLAGYAVISSSGNRTSYTYNMLLAEDTARRVKQQFISLYGEPLYTVGIGGSGGGLAQYLIGQNSEGILDGLLPLYSYPDMITQATYALDCDLLNNYFTFRTKNRDKWADWSQRQLIEGLNTLNDFPQRAGYLQPINQLLAGFVPTMPTGNSECIKGYFGLSSFINNPQQGFLRDFFHPKVVKATKWSFWQDLRALLGEDEQGFGLSTWDNVGVQYGLKALRDHKITVAEFLDLNQKVGSWKAQAQMKKELIVTPFGRKMPIWLSLWGNQNITEPINKVAKRHQGSIQAMYRAYRSGQVFIGKVGLPIIDIRHYLEDDLDMHHVSASFYSRLRIAQANGHSDNHVIWLAHKDYDPLSQAFELMDEWLLNSQRVSTNAVIASKPPALRDTCFAKDGSVIAQGKGVFNGQWNNLPAGMCQTVYPMYSTSRIQAGGSWAGDLFKCALIPVSVAIKADMYGAHDLSRYQTALEAIFPDGVCDYSAADLGRPADI